MENPGIKESKLARVIGVDEEKCVNCHACIDACPVKYCNDATGNVVTINSNLCIACGACLSACTHDARYFIDDFDIFIKDIKSGQKIIAITDPSTIANFPNKYKNLNGWLRSLGVSAVFDVSFGAELMIMSYVNHIMANEPKLVISQSCPAIVSYIEIYKPELLEYLAPVESPALHTIRMIRHYFPKYKDYKVALLSPCAARKREFEERGLGDYNISFISLNDYFIKNKVILSRYPEIDYDNEPAERAALISSPGGLLRTVERWMPDIRGNSRIIEGPDIIYDYFDTLYEQVKNGRTPLLIDCLNCDFGCNQGPLTIAQNHPVDEIEHWIEKRNIELQEYHRKEAGGGNDASRRNIEKILGGYWKEGLYNRDFINLGKNNIIDIPTIESREKYYKKMLKETEQDVKNCMGCGYKTCEAMVTAIHNNLNKIGNCTVYLQKKASQSFTELNRTKRSLENIIENLPFGVVLIGKDFKIRDLNPSALKMTEYASSEELIHKPCSDIFINIDEKCLSIEKEKQRQRLEIKTKSGSIVPILKSMIPVNYKNEEMFLIGFIDITKIVEAEQKGKELQKTLEKKITERTQELEKSLDQLKKTQENLKMAKENAEQANKLKSEFLANMSHEIRTPMNAILGFTKVLMEEETNKEKQEHLETISNAGENLLNLINEILDFSKIEADKLEIVEEPFSFKKLLLHFEKMMKVRAKNKGIFFNVSVADTIPERLIGDRHRINQILINLAGNSIKFTELGGVMVNCTYTESEGVRIEVQDTGIGIAKNKQKDIFEPFRQADGTTTRKFGGTGLGLAISLKLIKMMGGEITLLSEEGLGSKFSFTLPLKKYTITNTESLHQKPPEKIVEKLVEKVNYSKKVIAIIDDNDKDKKLIAEMLKAEDFTIVFLKNQENVVDEILRVKADLVILDLMMKDLDGFTINKLLKANIKTARIPVIVVSIKDEEDAKDIIQYGIMDYLQKPVDKEVLLKHVYSMLKYSRDIKNVFIIDDDENVLKLYRNYLRNHQYNAFAFNNAPQALEEIEKSTLPDLIILDLKMPGMDGFQFLKVLREKYTQNELPVIIVTGIDLSLEQMKILRDETLAIYKKGIDTQEKFTNYLNKYFNKGNVEITRYLSNIAAVFGNESELRYFIKLASDILYEMEDNIIGGNLSLICSSVDKLFEFSQGYTLPYYSEYLTELSEECLNKNADIIKIGRLYLEIREFIEAIFDGLTQVDFTTINFGKPIRNSGKKREAPADRILVVEDQMPNQKLIEIFIRQMNRECDMAENGKVALDMMRNRKYDIVLLDMHMPVMNGLETIAEIRKDEKLKDCYVIALTADAMKGDAEKYVEAGCDAYLSKPINKLALEKKIKFAEQLRQKTA